MSEQTIVSFLDMAGSGLAVLFAYIAVKEMAAALRECRESQLAILERLLGMLSETPIREREVDGH